MDPISAFSTAAACVTLIDFGAKFLKLLKVVSQREHVPDLKDLQARAKTLSRLHKQLRNPPQDNSTVTDVQRQEIIQHLKLNSKRIRDAANKCYQTADQLLVVLNNLLDASQTGTIRSLKRTVSLIRHQRTIEKLVKALEDARMAYDSAVLHQLQPSLEFALSEQSAGFAAMQSHIDEIVDSLQYKEYFRKQELANGEIINAISDQGVKMREVVSNLSSEVRNMSIISEASELRKAALDALFYPEYTARKEQVEQALKETFEWIFNEDRENVNRESFDMRWSSFSNWMKNEDDLYWIHGKAGSGKSTLCSFIVDHPHTDDLVTKWASGEKVHFASFFFWNPGTELQKSVNGCLRSMLYQLASTDDEILDEICTFLDIYRRRVPTLTDTRLGNAMHNLLTNSNRRFFILMDGLDEFEGDTRVLLSLCNHLRHIVNVKLVVSSRSQPPFHRTFAQCPSLRLQDFNHLDIRQYVSAELEEGIEELGNKITYNASGIFLWAKLVVRSVNNAYLDGDNLRMLYMRVERCPRELGELYDHLLRSIDPFYQQEAAFYFLIVVKYRKFYLIQLLLAAKLNAAVYLPAGIDEEVSSPLTVDQCRRFINRISYCTKGLLECHTDVKCQRDWESETAHLDYKLPSQGIDTIEDQLWANNITYMHRTAAEYVHEHLEKYFDVTLMAKENLSLSWFEAQVELILNFPLCRPGFLKSCHFSAEKLCRTAAAIGSSVAIKYPNQKTSVENNFARVYHYLASRRENTFPPPFPYYARRGGPELRDYSLENGFLDSCAHFGFLEFVARVISEIGEPVKLFEILQLFTWDLMYDWGEDELQFQSYNLTKAQGVRATLETLSSKPLWPPLTNNHKSPHNFIVGDLRRHIYQIEQFSPYETSSRHSQGLRSICGYWIPLMRHCRRGQIGRAQLSFIVETFHYLALITQHLNLFVSSSFRKAYQGEASFPGSAEVFFNLKLIAQAWLYHVGHTEAVFEKPSQLVKIVCYRDSQQNNRPDTSILSDSHLPEMLQSVRHTVGDSTRGLPDIRNIIKTAEDKFGLEITTRVNNDNWEFLKSLFEPIQDRSNAFLNGSPYDVRVEDFILREKRPFIFDNNLDLREIFRRLQAENSSLSEAEVIEKIKENTTDDLREMVDQEIFDTSFW